MPPLCAPRAVDPRLDPPHDTAMDANNTLLRQWEVGQAHLAAGRYHAARAALERAARQALRQRDWQTLARVHLPLLEVRRLMRYRAVEGRIVILHEGGTAAGGRLVKDFLRQGDGTLVIGGIADRALAQLASRIHSQMRRTGACLECLILLRHGGDFRIAAPAAPVFADGIPVRWTHDALAAIGASTDATLTLPLPPAGVYDGKQGSGALARESLLVAWEALALRWQARHPLPGRATTPDEISWLCQALAVDPACEPVAMRLMALGEAMERHRIPTIPSAS